MLAKARSLRAVLCFGVALAGAAGCLAVYPLDPLQDGAGGNGAGGEHAGGGVTSSGAVDAGAGQAGEPGAGKSGSAGSGGCSSNLECNQRSADIPYRCLPSNHQCVQLTSSDCQLAYGEFSDPNAIYFGAFASLNRTALDQSSIVWSHLLALDELSGSGVGGLPDGPNGVRRHLIMIVCDSNGDVDAAMKHLAEDVQVPAIIATLQPEDLRSQFEDYKAHDIFYLSPVSANQTLAVEQDSDLIWNLLGQPSDMAPTYPELLKLAEKRLRKERNMQPSDQLKVALVTTTTAFDGELQRAVSPLLRFNGQSAQDNGTSYFPVTLDPASLNLAKTAEDVADFGPDVIISAASELFSMQNGLLEDIEDVWGVAQVAKPRPFYILSPYNAGDLSTVRRLMDGFIQTGTEDDPQLRFVGVTIAGPRDNRLQKAYELHLHTKFQQAELDTANYYDATYFLAYAIYGAGTDTPLTGSSIAKGMKRLLAGDNYDVGPGQIDFAFDALRIPGSTIHVGSTLGPPDFDAKTGVRPVEGGVLCFKKVGFAVELHNDVLRYDGAAHALTGTFPCFSGFYP